ncbi:MAG: hypothetical protein RLY16_317, partial [Bacteroidota bacterium]
DEGTQIEFDYDTVKWMINKKILITGEGITYDLPEKLFY